MLGAVFSDIVPPGPAPAVPAFARVQYAPHAAEVGLHQADHALDSLPAWMHQPGAHLAEGGPVHRLQQAQGQAASALASALPTLQQEWQANDAALAQRWQALQTYARENGDRLDTKQQAALQQQLHLLAQDLAAHEQRRHQLEGYAHRLHPGLVLQIGGKLIPLSQIEPQQAGVANPDLFTRTGGLFPVGPAEGGLPAAIRTVSRGVFAADNMLNAGAAHMARQIHANGPGALFHGDTWLGAQDAALQALLSGRDVPPTAVRDLFGLKAGKASKAAYDLAAVLDYGLGLTMAPSNLILGPGYEKLAAPLVKAGAKAVVKPALTKAGELIAEHLPGLAELGERVGTEIGVGGGAADVRGVKRPYRMELSQRLQEAGQIAREVRDATVSLRKASPAFDEKEMAWAGAHNGASRLQELVSRYLVDPNSALRQATAEGIDGALVKQFGDRLAAHAEATLTTLEKNGAVKPRWQGGPLFRPGSPERNGFLAGYADRVFGRATGTTLAHAGVQGVERGGIGDVERAAQANLTSHVAADPNLAQPIAAGQPLNPGWVEIPQEARFGSLQGKQVSGPVARFVMAELNPERLAGNPTELQGLGRQVVNKVILPFVGARKRAILLGNPSGLATSLGARLAAAQIAAQRSGVAFGTPRVIGHLLSDAGGELWQYLRTGAQSADIAELNRYSPAFMNSFGTMVGEASKKSPAALSGTGGKILRLGGRALYVPPDLPQQIFGSGAAAHGWADMGVKLALYKALKPKLGPEAAAKMVEAHLFDYSDQPALLEQLNKYGIWSFNAWPTKAAGLTLRTIAEKPSLAARYPRLRALLMQDIPGASTTYQNLPDYQKGPFVFPVGSNQFLNAGRLFPFTESMGLLQGSQEPDSEQTLGDKLLAHSLFGSALGNLLLGRNVQTGRPIVAPGTPPDVARQQQLDALREDLKTSFQRGVERVQRARRGETTSASKNALPQTVGQALAQSLGVPLVEGWTPERKAAVLERVIQSRSESAGKFVDDLDQGYRAAANPYTESVGGLQPAQLRRRMLEARGYLKQQVTAANNFKGNGELTDAGRTRLERGYLFHRALADRLDSLDQ